MIIEVNENEESDSKENTKIDKTIKILKRKLEQ